MTHKIIKITKTSTKVQTRVEDLSFNILYVKHLYYPKNVFFLKKHHFKINTVFATLRITKKKNYKTKLKSLVILVCVLRHSTYFTLLLFYCLLIDHITEKMFYRLLPVGQE